MKKILPVPSSAVAAIVAAGLFLPDMTMAQAPAPDVTAVIIADPNLTTLAAALRAAELVETLQARGPYTVFAPNNAAFAKLPAGTLEALMMPENRAKLRAILSNHVLREKVMAADVAGGSPRMLGGGRVDLGRKDGIIFFGESTVRAADRDASNGVVHVIDTVVLPD